MLIGAHYCRAMSINVQQCQSSQSTPDYAIQCWSMLIGAPVGIQNPDILRNLTSKHTCPAWLKPPATTPTLSNTKEHPLLPSKHQAQDPWTNKRAIPPQTRWEAGQGEMRPTARQIPAAKTLNDTWFQSTNRRGFLISINPTLPLRIYPRTLILFFSKWFVDRSLKNNKP